MKIRKRFLKPSTIRTSRRSFSWTVTSPSFSLCNTIDHTPNKDEVDLSMCSIPTPFYVVEISSSECRMMRSDDSSILCPQRLEKNVSKFRQGILVFHVKLTSHHSLKDEAAQQFPWNSFHWNEARVFLIDRGFWHFDPDLQFTLVHRFVYAPSRYRTEIRFCRLRWSGNHSPERDNDDVDWNRTRTYVLVQKKKIRATRTYQRVEVWMSLNEALSWSL